MTDPDPLRQRLRSSSESLRVSPEARAAHVAAIDDALRPPHATSLSGWRQRRRQVAAAAAAVLVLGPGGLAAASSDALPGDALYPAKRLVESVVSVVDDDFAAQHRVEELEGLIERGAGAEVIDEATLDAERAVGLLDGDHPLYDELARLVANNDEDPDPERSGGEDDGVEPDHDRSDDDEGDGDDDHGSDGGESDDDDGPEDDAGGDDDVDDRSSDDDDGSDDDADDDRDDDPSDDDEDDDEDDEDVGDDEDDDEEDEDDEDDEDEDEDE